LGENRRELGLQLHIERMIGETLDCFVAPAVRAELLDSARRANPGGQLPANASALRDFLSGPLRRVLARRLGADLAATVLRQFEASASTLPPPGDARQRIRPARISSGSLRAVSAPPRGCSRTSVPGGRRTSSTPPRRSHTPAPTARLGTAIGRVRPPVEGSGSAPRAGGMAPGPSESEEVPLGAEANDWEDAADTLAESTTRPMRQLPLVLVVSRDGAALTALRALLDPRAAVEQVTSLFGLLHQIDAARGARCVVVLDCRQPPVRPAALAALADEFPASVRTVVWGATVELERSLREVSVAAAQWSRLTSDRPRQLAAHCARLVG
jgi:hypothetical protein